MFKILESKILLKNESSKSFFCKLIKSDILFIFFLCILFIVVYRDFIFGTPVDSYRMLYYFHFAKSSILKFHSFPNWTLGYYTLTYTYDIFSTYEFFAMPETPVLTPFLALYFVSSIVTGEKISLALHLITGIVGIFAIGKLMKISRIGIVIMGISFFISDNLASQYTSGHINWKTIFYFPWIFYFFLKSFQSWKWLIPCALTNILILFEGGIHIFIWVNMFLAAYSFFSLIDSKKLKNLIYLGFLIMATSLVGSIKIIPMIHFFGHYTPPQEFYGDPRASVAPPYSLKNFWTAITTPNWGAEYANYIGIPLIIVFSLAILYGLKKCRPLVFTSLFFLLLTVEFHGVSLFKLIDSFPVLNTQRIPPRFFLMSLFGFGCLSGMFITEFSRYLKERLKRIKIPIIEMILIAFSILIFFDLNRVFQYWPNQCPHTQHFDYPPVSFSYNPSLIPDGEVEQKYAAPNYRIWRIKLKEDSKVLFRELEWKLYKNILKFKAFRRGKFEKLYPQNYNGSVAVLIPKDTKLLSMRYSSPYFYAGLIISVITAVLMAFICFKPYIFKRTKFKNISK